MNNVVNLSKYSLDEGTRKRSQELFDFLNGEHNAQNMYSMNTFIVHF